MQGERNTWNDERMDDFAQRTEANFSEVRVEIEEMRQDVKEVRLETNAKIDGLRSEMNVRFAGLDRRFDIMIGAIVSGFVGLIISHLIG